jgi:hypothetical protein
MTGRKNASPFQAEPPGANKAYFDRQAALSRLIAERRAQRN